MGVERRSKTAQSLRLLALTTVLDDLADRSQSPSSEHGRQELVNRFCEAKCGTASLDSLLVALSTRARLSDSACVCALVYLGRVDAGVCPSVSLTHENVHNMLIAALAISAAYVDRRDPMELVRSIAHVVKLSEHVVRQMRDALVSVLGHQTYISLATFREYDDILDDIIDAS